jgi:predicted Co/Zn/Cd cation transporter (cation efflux family)
MTDESHENGHVDEPAEAAAPESKEVTAGAGAGDFTSGEGLVALAGMILLVIWVVFDIFLDDYGVGTLTLLLAALVVIAPRIRRDTVEKILPLPVIMKLAGYTLALIGAIAVIEAIEEGFFEGAATVIAALAEYAAFAIAFIGARQIKT